MVQLVVLVVEEEETVEVLAEQEQLLKVFLEEPQQQVLGEEELVEVELAQQVVQESETVFRVARLVVLEELEFHLQLLGLPCFILVVEAVLRKASEVLVQVVLE
jgi:hypothetical protein